MSVEAITFRCADSAKPLIRDAAQQISDNRRTAGYEVGETKDMITDDCYVSIDMTEAVSVTEAEKLVRLIHAEAGNPNLEALLWAPSGGVQRLGTVIINSSSI